MEWEDSIHELVCGNNGYIMTKITFFYFCVPSYFIYV